MSYNKVMSTMFIDQKYTNILSARLAKFKQIKPQVYKFQHSCEDPSHPKQRGYIFPAGDGLNVYCHHCGMSHKLGKFIQLTDPNLYQEYNLETFKNRCAPTEKINIVFESQDLPDKGNELQTLDSDIKWVSELSPTHPAREYVSKRMIPEKFFNKIGIVRDFNKFAAKYEDSFKEKTKVYPRLIFPFYDKDNKVYRYSCRAFGNEKPKYIKLIVDPSAAGIYGLWRIDEEKDIFVVEGQIDSLFLDNAIAVGSADYSSKYIQEHRDKLIIVPDSDYKRNPQVYQSLVRAVESGLRVALLPESIPWKDINDCVVKGNINSRDLQDILRNNISSGLSAKLELSYRKRF